MANLSTPGVYINEQSAFPNSVVAVETAIPVFIGYTAKAERNGKSLIHVPTKINSFNDYLEAFGGALKTRFKILEDTSVPAGLSSFKVGEKMLTISYEKNNELYFFNSIRLFYANGGGACIILAVNTYGYNAGGQEINATDFSKADGLFEILAKSSEPTLIVMPDVAKLKEAAYPIYADVFGALQSHSKLFWNL